MQLLKTSLLNSIAVIVRTITAIGLNKVLALSVGSAGYAYIGHFQNAITMATVLGGGALNTGVIKYTAEYYDDPARCQKLWRTAGALSTIACAIVGLLLILLRHVLARSFFGDESYSALFIWLALFLFPFILNTLLLAILNGRKEIRRYVLANIAGSLLGAAVTSILALSWGLLGALIALTINQSIALLATLTIIRKIPDTYVRQIFSGYDRDSAYRLGRYALMALTSAIVIPASQILMRNSIVDSFGWVSAGHWQAVTKMSDLYLMLITTTLGVYYLPRLSEIRTSSELRHEIGLGYATILPLTALGCGAIYVLRSLIIPLLFSAEFSPVQDLLPWQLAGDICKIGSWLLAYVMVGRAMTKLYISTEIIFAFLPVILLHLLSPAFGLQAAVMSYTLNYLLYWLTMALVMTRYFSGDILPKRAGPETADTE